MMNTKWVSRVGEGYLESGQRLLGEIIVEAVHKSILVGKEEKVGKRRSGVG
jgi:hypothetical protein